MIRSRENTMNDDLTAGEFEAVTGLTPKALRLYAERGILSPASVNPLNGYRGYERAQVRHGITLDLLRRAQVPMTDLVLAGNFDFEGRRQIVEVQRLLEDFHLDVAERVASFDPGDFIAHSHSAPAADWVGVIIDLALPEDIEGRIETFSGLALDAPAVGRGLSEALADLGMGRPEAVWTAVPDAPRSGGSQMLIAYPTPYQLDHRSRDLIAAQVRSLTGWR